MQYFSVCLCHKHAVIKCQPALKPHLKMCPLRTLQILRNHFCRKAENWMTCNKKKQFDFCTNTDKLKSSCLGTASVTRTVTLCPPCMSFTSDPVHSSLINDKAENHMLSVSLSEAIRASQQYLQGPCQGQAAVHPKTLQAHNCFSDGTLASWSQHGTHSHNIWVGVFQQT